MKGEPVYGVPKPAPRAKKKRVPMKAHSTTKRPPAGLAAAHAKPSRVRDPEHLQRVATMPCLLAGHPDHGCNGFTRYGRRGSVIVIQAAHVRGKGAFGGDEQVIPLCEWAHQLSADSLHKLNVPGFDKRWGLNVRKVAQILYDETLELRGKATP